MAIRKVKLNEPGFFIAKALILCFLVLSALADVAPADMADRMVEKGLNEGLRKKIFLDLRDINVVDVLKFLALEGNINIVTSKNVQGRSTLLLRNVSIGDALEIITVSNDLAYDIKGEIIYMMTEDEYFEVYGKKYNDKRKMVTRTLRYAKPSYAATSLQAVQSAIGKIIVDEDTGTVIMIDTDEKIAEMQALINDMEQKQGTQVVKLQYAQARDLETQLRDRLDTKKVGTIVSDTRSNQLVVTAYPDRMSEVLRLIKELDTPDKAVSVDTKILQLTLNPKYDHGIDWSKTFQDSSHDDLRNLRFNYAFPIDTNLSTATALNTVAQYAIGDINEDDFEVELKSLKQIENTKVLANPSLMILDRQEARINIGDRIPYVVTTTTGTGNNVTNSEEIKFIDVGITLAVRPIINDDGFITMTIRPEISSQTGSITTPLGGAVIPKVNTTFIESSVVVKDGITVILGGLRRDDLSEVNKGVPYLMDVPVLGQLFQNRNEEMKRTEIVIFLTPTIVTGAKEYTRQPIDIRRERQPSDLGSEIGLNKMNSVPAPVTVSGTALGIKRSRIPSHSAA